jgi:N utilization substance protein B
VEGVLSERDRLDEVIAKAAPQWPVDQLSAIDRNILRLAIWEILVNNRAPIRAAINEAVELAKEYGSDNSAKFVNGVLGSVSLTLAR